ELPGDGITDAAKAVLTRGRGAILLLAAAGAGTFSNDDQCARVAVFDAAANKVCKFVETERYLGNQNRVRTPGETPIKRDPARVPSHDFDDHHALVRASRRV